eukprot:sb/3469669/
MVGEGGETGDPLGNGQEYLVIDHCGIRIGLLGLVELGWMETLSTIEMDEIIYIDYLESADHYGAMLKEEKGCDIVIALTHMRWNNDRRLAVCAKYVDLVLGGHDHNYGVEEIEIQLGADGTVDFFTLKGRDPFTNDDTMTTTGDNETLTTDKRNHRTIVKSGTDFRQFSKVTVRISPDQPIKTVVEKLEVTSDLPSCPNMIEVVNEYNVNKILNYYDLINLLPN